MSKQLPPPMPATTIFQDGRGGVIRATRDGSVMIVHAPEPVVVTTPGAQRLVESLRSIGRVPATTLPPAALDAFTAKVDEILHQKEITVKHVRLTSVKEYVLTPEDASFKAHQAELIRDLAQETVRNYL